MIIVGKFNRSELDIRWFGLVGIKKEGATKIFMVMEISLQVSAGRAGIRIITCFRAYEYVPLK